MPLAKPRKAEKQLVIHDRGETAEVLLYDEIGGDPFFGGGITAKTFREQMKSIKAKTVNLRINSPGGSVFEASAMMAALDEFKGRVEVDIDGMAASAASVVAMAGDEIRMAPAAMMMIHNPHALVIGGAAEMRSTADLLDKSKGQLVEAYQRQSKASRKQIEAWMDAETWFTGAEAVEAGLAHSVTEAPPIAASANFRMIMARLGYRHVPAALKAQMTSPNPADIGVGDCVEWMSEDPDELSAELEDGHVEEIGELVRIPGTSLELAGTADDPAVRVIDDDDDEEPCWYLVRMSQLRKAVMDDDDAKEMNGDGMGGGMMGMKSTNVPGSGTTSAEAWAETEKRRKMMAELNA